ncbi:target of rapamycin complex subunit LST8 [Schistosoma japonicum]|nr:target of rapamycin complex subunit LST8 [Schistosoma japonicum]
MKNDYDSNLSLATGEFSRDGQYLAASGYGRVRIYDIQGPATPFVMVSDFTKNVNTVGFNDTGNWMFAGAEDRVAKIIDWRAGGNLWITRIYQVILSLLLNYRGIHQ